MVKALKLKKKDLMLVSNTPIEDYRKEYGLWVKREDLSCPPPGPPFSKTRGVFARVQSRPEKLIGVLDTSHSQAGHAVARACQLLGKKCINFYPEFKYQPGPKPPQLKAQELGAELYGLSAGMSAVLFYQARKVIREKGGYLMPNALKLQESVTETAKECVCDFIPKQILIPISSGTIAAGVMKGFGNGPKYLIHMGYHRSHKEVADYLREQSGVKDLNISLIDEGYEYKDAASGKETPPWPCNVYYDLKAFQWWLQNRNSYTGNTLFWNIG